MWQLLERLKVIAKKHDTRCGTLCLEMNQQQSRWSSAAG